MTNSADIKKRVDEKAMERIRIFNENNKNHNDGDEKDIQVPIIETVLLETMDYYAEINFAIVLQYMAYNLSIKQGINPDKPRNLAKVVTVQ